MSEKSVRPPYYREPHCPGCPRELVKAAIEQVIDGPLEGGIGRLHRRIGALIAQPFEACLNGRRPECPMAEVSPEDWKPDEVCEAWARKRLSISPAELEAIKDPRSGLPPEELNQLLPYFPEDEA